MAFRNSSQLITIGEFARLGGVSVKALRVYARIGLLPPVVINPQSRYRLYSRAQLSKLHRILLLKNAGLPLAQMVGHLSHPDEAGLSKLRASLAARAEEIQRQLSWVEAEIQAARNGAHGVTPVVIKRVPGMSVWSKRQRIDSYDHADIILRDRASQTSVSAQLVSGAVWHDCGQKTKIIDCEAFRVLNRGLRPGASKELAPATVASILHEGDESTIGASYETVRRWITDNRFRVAGPNREIYLGQAEAVGNERLTDIQFPIEMR